MRSLTRRNCVGALAASLSLSGLGLSGCKNISGGRERLKLAHSLNQTHPVHIAMEFMGDRLSELSSGKMGLDIYPNGQLGSERQLIELLQIGAVSMTKVSTISMEGFSPAMKLFSIPYLFEDNAHFWRVLNGEVGTTLLNSLRDVKLQGLAYYDAGSRSFYTTKFPVESPASIDSKKIRVMSSRTSIQMIESMGGAATPISWGELYSALQQGIVDGAENNLPSYYLSKHYETAKYLTLDEHTSVPDLVIMSRRVFDNMSEQERGWLRQAMDESVVYERKLWAEASADALKKVKEAGVEVIYPDKAPFREAVKGIKADFAETELGPLIEKVDALRSNP